MHTKPHLRWMEHFVEQLLASRLAQLVENVAGGIRETSTKSQNILKLIGVDKANGFCTRGLSMRMALPVARESAFRLQTAVSYSSPTLEYQIRAALDQA